jgi:hypothetical protein
MRRRFFRLPKEVFSYFWFLWRAILAAVCLICYAIIGQKELFADFGMEIYRTTYDEIDFKFKQKMERKR